MYINVNSYPQRARESGVVSWRPIVLLLLLLAAVQCPAGDKAYGEEFFRAGSNWPESGTLMHEGPPAPSPESMAEYQRQLESLQDIGGPYSDGLAEPLSGLARSHLANGDVEEATRLYGHALHIVRINDGLYSERQIPILQSLLQVYRSSGDLESLDQRYDYYFRLFGSGKPPFTEVRLRAALGYARWQREALRQGMDDERHRRLLNLYKMNDELIKAVALDREVTNGQYNDVVLSQLRNLYLLDDRIQPRLEKIGVVASTPSFGGEWEQSDFDRRRLEVLQRGAMSQGAQLLKEAIARSGDKVTPVELAKLHLELADWYQWHGSASAASQYTRVVEILSDSGQETLLEQWLGQPVELPDNGVFWQPREDSGSRRIQVNTRYDVSTSGRVSNATGSTILAEDEGKASRLTRRLRKIRFRPRWASGEAEAVTGVERRYEWVD